MEHPPNCPDCIVPAEFLEGATTLQVATYIVLGFIMLYALIGFIIKGFYHEA